MNPQVGLSALEFRDLRHCRVPAPFQLGRHQAVAGVHRVVLLSGARRLVLQLLELSRQRLPVLVGLRVELIERCQTRPDCER